MVATSITLGRNTPAQRTFEVVPAGTLAQDVWMMNAVRRAGLDVASIGADQITDATAADSFLTAIVERVFKADVVADVLAACLVEPSRRSSLTTAEAWQAYLKETRDLIATTVNQDEKRELLNLLAQVIQGFLSSGRNS